MMTAMTKMVMTAMFGLVMFGAGDAAAAREGGPRHEQRGGKMCERLECSADQKVKIAEIRARAKPAVKAEREAVRELKAQLVAEYRKDRLDTAKVKGLREQLDARKAAMKRQREAMKAQVEALLTPAQKTRLTELKAERGHKGKKFGHHGRGKHGPRHGRAHGV